jgi:hypothetical protein
MQRHRKAACADLINWRLDSIGPSLRSLDYRSIALVGLDLNQAKDEWPLTLGGSSKVIVDMLATKFRADLRVHRLVPTARPANGRGHDV